MKRPTLRLRSLLAIAGMASLFLSTADAEEAASATTSEEASAVATALSGKLIKLAEGDAVTAEVAGDPEYFVFYHSASW